MAFSVLSPGAIRSEILARAVGTRVLLAPSTWGASRPVTVSDGLVHSRSTLEPEPMNSTPSAIPDSARSRSTGYSTSAAEPVCSPSTATLPRVVVQAGEEAAQGHQRVGHEAAPHPGVDGVGEGADADVDPDEAAQAGGQRGDADVPVAAVGDHDHVGAEVVTVLGEQVGEGVGADLLLALDEHGDPDVEVVAEGADRGEVGHDAGLVVGSAAGVEAAVALGRLERSGVPRRVVVLGLDVVVGVEQHGRLARRRRLARQHGGAPAVLPGADDADVLEGLRTEQLGHGLGAALHLPGPRRDRH